MGRDGRRSREVGLVDRAAYQRHAPQGPLLGGLLPLCRVPPRRDLGDAPFLHLVPGLAPEEAERLRRRRGQQGPHRAAAVGITTESAAEVRAAAATARTAPGREPHAPDSVAEA